MVQQASLNLPTTPAKSPSLLEVINGLLRSALRKRDVLVDQLKPFGCHSSSHLSEVLGGSKHFPEAWLKFIAENYDPERLISTHVAAWQGREVRPPRRIDDAAFRRATEHVLAQHNGMGAALRAEIEAHALAEPETDQ